jgi:hypothetical protein
MTDQDLHLEETDVRELTAAEIDHVSGGIVASAHGSGGGAGKVSMNDFHFVMRSTRVAFA